MPEILEDFDPTKKKGRQPLVDIKYFKRFVDQNPGKWVSDVFSQNEAVSVKRQFKLLGGYEVRTSKAAKEGMREVVVRRGQ